MEPSLNILFLDGATMKLCMIGTGYVGLVTGCCFADMGNDVICVDNNPEKIERLKKGAVDIYEPGLSDLMRRNLSHDRLSFTTDLAYGVKNAEIIFIAVGTPPNDDGKADTSQVMNVARSIGKAMNGYKIIVTKSTVPVGTTESVGDAVARETNHPFDIVSNPEFLKEGAAVEDFMRPERIVIGSRSGKATEGMRELYAPYTRTGNPILVMDIRSAELSKYAANALLATKISFMNEIANLCDHLGADIESIRLAIGADSRIGHKFLFAGVGFGGSCFPKDLSALIATADTVAYRADIIRAVKDVNDRQRDVFVNKIRAHFGDSLKDRSIALWGLSFKPNTDDIRDAPAVFIAEGLLTSGARVSAFDPAGTENFRTRFGKSIRYARSAYDAVKDADALCLLTEWNEFRNPDFERMKRTMKSPVIFDGRNQYNREELERTGFVYYCVGRPSGEMRT
jgi:UDPglucose 6-dehydrogenase